jgi:threonine synthase
MDIQVSSNFERLLFEANGRDGAIVRGLMKDLGVKGHFAMSETALAFMRERFSAVRATEAEVTSKLREVHKTTGAVLEPHTAVGLVGADRAGAKGPVVVLATAHPAKFPEAVEQATGVRPQLPDQLKGILKSPERCDTLPADIEAVKTYIRERTKV